ncbi:tetratricopeptide repeat protein [Flavitalea flava]
MNSKIRYSLLVAGLVGLSNLLFAQTVEQGKKFYYYQRYKSALDAFDKTLASNPNSIDAVYWKGQTLIQQKDSAGAETLYKKALESNGNAPLLLVGIGHIELKQGKTADGRQRFEMALTLTKSKDVNVINAIGWANVEAKSGDAAYAIEKLNLATQVKNFNNADTYLILGDAYRKMIDGGSAVQSYQKALTLDSKNAAAKFKIGMIYLTQNNKDYFIPAFEEATQLDPNYAPAFYQLYFYYFFRDINKAKDYYDKYLAVSDPSPENDYERASIKWASKDFDGAITQAKADLAKLGDAATPKYYKLIAYSYDSKGDSVSAKDFLDQYFTKQKPDGFLPKDYSFRAQLLSKFPGNDSLVNLNYQTALSKDTAQAEKIDIIKEASDLFKKKGNKMASAYWQGQLYNTLKSPVNTDLYNLGIAYYQAASYKSADSVFCGIYESKYPTEIYGYLWCARSKQAQDDSTNSQGLAVEAYDKLAQMARGLDSTAKVAGTADSVKYKTQITSSYFFLAQYYNDIKKDKQTAIGYLEKVLEVDPTNATAVKFLEMLKRPPAKQPAAKPKSAGGAGATKK